MSTTSDRLCAAIVDAVDGVVGTVGRPVALHEPTLGAQERDAVAECIESGWVSYGGPQVGAFERRLAGLTGAADAAAMVSGTAAMHLALVLLGVRPGDEVMLPSLTFVGTANPVAQIGAVPHFVDSDPDRPGLCPEALRRRLTEVASRRDGRVVNRETGRPIAAVIAVHLFGHPVDIDALLAVAEGWEIPVVEDAAESLGSRVGDRHTGIFGHIGTLSFNGNKVVTTGGGGALLARDPALMARARHLSTTAKRPHRWDFDHDAVAYNYRLPALNAALGLAQLDRLDDTLRAKRTLAARYRDAFAGIEGVRFVDEPSGTTSNYWLNAILLDRADLRLRDEVLGALHAAGLLARPAWRPMHHLPMYRDAPRGPLTGTEDARARLINLPSSAFLARDQA